MNLRLNHLRLHNFRCFGECAITFHENLTVLVADNGRGKTAIMDAAALALARFVDEFTGSRQSDGIGEGDVRLVRGNGNSLRPQLPTQLDAAATIDGSEVEWSCWRKQLHRGAMQFGDAESELFDLVHKLRSNLSPQSSGEFLEVLPIVVYYASTRFSRRGDFGTPLQSKTPRFTGRRSGYGTFLDPLIAQQFNDWYHEKHRDAQSHIPSGARGEASPFKLLAAVRDAVDTILEPTEWGRIDWDEQRRCVVAEHPVQGKLPLNVLSSGIRGMITVAADLAQRCARLNPMFGEDATRLTPGLVLIDEIDLHLHPAWQQRVVGLLREAFPAIQFILSTHSPQVLSTVNSESIRVIKLCDGNGQIETPQFQTRGVESADILAKLMDVDPVPKIEEAGWLSDYRAFVQNAQYETAEARELWQRLVAHFGVIHPVLAEIEVLRRLQEFKLRNHLTTITSVG